MMIREVPMLTKTQITAQTDAIVRDYMAKCGKIIVVPASRKTVKTFRMSGSVANKGAKAITLRNSGLYLR